MNATYRPSCLRGRLDNLALKRDERGFTLIELLVVMALIAILTSLLMPALVVSKMKAQGTYCLGNLKQLSLGWTLYSQDFGDFLAPNSDNPDNNAGQEPQDPGWVAGTMSYATDPASLSDDTNTDLLVGPYYAQFGSLGIYTQNARVYHCPGDKSAVIANGTTYMRVRSVSMNGWVGFGTRDWGEPESPPYYKLNIKMSHLQNPGPSETWVFIDEREDSINDGWFAVDMVHQGSMARWVDIPANYHNRAGTLAFADGHAQFRKWLDARTMPPLVSGAPIVKSQFTPNNPDVSWLQSHTTGLTSTDPNQ
jgi:prepilin-type N-terminal cleavage/methylation domain-containing protein/prepilin-type processing-associated H-X9-DG protein